MKDTKHILCNNNNNNSEKKGFLEKDEGGEREVNIFYNNVI